MSISVLVLQNNHIREIPLKASADFTKKVRNEEQREVLSDNHSFVFIEDTKIQNNYHKSTEARLHTTSSTIE